MAQPTDRVAVTGIGMVSSLGFDAATSCAAARAGLRKAGPLDFKVVNSETKERAAIFGHTLPQATLGFEGVARLLRIAQLAFADFQAGTNLRRLEAKRCGLVLALPAPRPNPTSQAKEAPADPLDKPSPNPAAGLADPKTLAERFRSVSKLALAQTNVAVVQSGHASFIQAVDKASAKLRAGEWDWCVIGAFDSLVEASTLQGLYDRGRLKCDDNPVGLEPAEAGVVVLLEPQQRALRDGAPVHALVGACVTGQEKNHFLSEESATGRELAAAVGRLNEQDENRTVPPWVIIDLNGEVYRSMDWGHALVRLSKDWPAFRDVSTVYPAAAFGDTGAASGAVGLCTAVRAFARRYAPSPRALVLSSSDEGARGALSVAAMAA
jgi:3-oxoacyl-[acyl-carrier-protein] synthase-1